MQKILWIKHKRDVRNSSVREPPATFVLFENSHLAENQRIWSKFERERQLSCFSLTHTYCEVIEQIELIMCIYFVYASINDKFT